MFGSICSTMDWSEINACHTLRLRQSFTNRCLTMRLKNIMFASCIQFYQPEHFVYILQYLCIHGNIISTFASWDTHWLWAALLWLLRRIAIWKACAMCLVVVLLAKIQVFWDMAHCALIDMASHPRRSDCTIIVLWHIMCNVTAHLLCLVKAEKVKLIWVLTDVTVPIISNFW